MDGRRARLIPTPELREKWQRRSDAAFERMYGGKSQEKLITMTEREDMAVLIAKELSAFLLEEHLALDPSVRPDEAAPPCCPKCSKPGQRAMAAKEKLPDRQMVTRAGEVQLERERWRCAKCRIIFFSVRCSAATGDGGLQSAAAAKSGAAGEQGGIV
jgi:hypothetical protein